MNVGKSIAAFERTLNTGPSPYDKYLAGDDQALSDAARRGMHTASQVGCLSCHFGPNFNGGRLPGEGVPYFRIFPVVEEMSQNVPDVAKYRLDDDPSMIPQMHFEIPLVHGLWKIPSWRNIEKTGPYSSHKSEWNLASWCHCRQHSPSIQTLHSSSDRQFFKICSCLEVTETVNAQNTIETLNLAKTKATELLAASSQDSTQVMMDPGTENKNGKVLQFIASQNLIRTLARVDVHYSNSMIESLFRMFKNNYLYHQGIHTLEDLRRKTEFYFREHNHVIPLATHKGGRPAEVFLSSWGESEKEELRANKLAAVLSRRKKNQAPSCGVCSSWEVWVIYSSR